jgi:serine/threonine-protein kinase
VEGVSLALNAGPVFTASPAGVLVYQPGTADETAMVRVSNVGRPEALFRGPGLWAPRFSPAGDLIAYARGASDRTPGGRDIWIYSARDGTNTRLTHGLSAAVDPAWSADGRRIAFSATEDGDVDIWVTPADGAEVPRRLLRRPSAQVQPIFTPDGGSVVFLDAGGLGNSDLLRTGTGPGAPIDTVVATSFDESTPALSPDGRWLAYQSAETGQAEVYVRPYPGPGARHLISTGGGREPAWGRQGGELYYRSGTQLILARMDPGTAVVVRGRTTLFDAPFIPGRGNRNYDVSPDGKSFVFLSNTVRPRLIVRLDALTAAPR